MNVITMDDLVNKITLGDSLQTICSIPDNSVQLICIDPPYFLLNHEWDSQWDNNEQYLEWCDLWFRESFRILRDDGAFYCFQDWRLVSEYVVRLKKIFPYFQNWITWERIKGRSSGRNWKSSKEEILYFSKSKTPRFFEHKKIRPVIAPYRDEQGNPKGWFVNEHGVRVRWTGIGNVWHYTPPVWSSKIEKPFHSTQKPLLMIERIIKAHTTIDDVVLDFFSGSGTTCVAAKRLGRRFIGVEKNVEFYEKSVTRLEMTKFQGDM